MAVAATILLDTILSSLFYRLQEWTPELTGNKSPFLLRHLVCKLYGAGRGDLFHAHAQVSQETLAAAVGISREWVNKLLIRLASEGWIEYHAPRLPDGHFLPCIFKAGGQLLRLIYAILRHRRPQQSRVNDPSQSSPTKRQIEESLNFIEQLKEELAAKLGKMGRR